MLFTVPSCRTVPDGHAGFVAGRYRNGAYSDIWTDVRRCADRTFTAYAPGCSCGWLGVPQPATEVGHLACRRQWLLEHIEALPVQAPRRRDTPALLANADV